MADKSIVPAHDDVRHLIDIIHYDEHPDRIETAEFRHNKETLHERIKKGEIRPCFIDNGYCEGQTEIHHYLVEYSAGNEVIWENVNEIFRMAGLNEPYLANPDQKYNLVPLCHKHHMGVGTGIHMITFPAWILQKFLNDKNLALFEAAVKELKEKDHPNHEDRSHIDHHMVNSKANALLHTIGHSA